MVKKKAMRRTVPREKKKSRTRAAIGPAELACRGKREKGCSPFPTGAHAHHGLRDGERLTVSEGRKEAGPFPSDIPRARKPITVDNSQWKEQPWERAPKNQLRYGTGPSSQHVGRHVQQRTVPVGIFNHGNLSQHVGGHGRQTMVLMPIRHVQYAAEPYRIRVNDKIGT